MLLYTKIAPCPFTHRAHTKKMEVKVKRVNKPLIIIVSIDPNKGLLKSRYLKDHDSRLGGRERIITYERMYRSFIQHKSPKIMCSLEVITS